MTLSIILAILAGAWRVVDGRGKVWFDPPQVSVTLLEVGA